MKLSVSFLGIFYIFLCSESSILNARSLHEACANGNKDEIESLLKTPPGKSQIDQCDVHGLTPLGWACDYGNLEAIKLLLNHKADSNKKDNNGYSPLHHACYQNSVDGITLLLEHGADVNIKDNNNMTPLHLACEKQNLKAITLLLNKEADIDVQNIAQETFLSYACKNNFLENSAADKIILLIKKRKNLSKEIFLSRIIIYNERGDNITLEKVLYNKIHELTNTIICSSDALKKVLDNLQKKSEDYAFLKWLDIWWNVYSFGDADLLLLLPLPLCEEKLITPGDTFKPFDYKNNGNFDTLHKKDLTWELIKPFFDYSRNQLKVQIASPNDPGVKNSKYDFTFQRKMNIFFVGHGSSDGSIICGIEGKHLSEILGNFNKYPINSVSLSACFLGGSKMHLLPKDTDQQSQLFPFNYLVVIYSITDSPTYTFDFAYENRYFSFLEKYHMSHCEYIPYLFRRSDNIKFIISSPYILYPGEKEFKIINPVNVNDKKIRKIIEQDPSDPLKELLNVDTINLLSNFNLQLIRNKIGTGSYELSGKYLAVLVSPTIIDIPLKIKSRKRLYASDKNHGTDMTQLVKDEFFYETTFFPTTWNQSIKNNFIHTFPLFFISTNTKNPVHIFTDIQLDGPLNEEKNYSCWGNRPIFINKTENKDRAKSIFNAGIFTFIQQAFLRKIQQVSRKTFFIKKITGIDDRALCCSNPAPSSTPSNSEITLNNIFISAQDGADVKDENSVIILYQYGTQNYYYEIQLTEIKDYTFNNPWPLHKLLSKSNNHLQEHLNKLQEIMKRYPLDKELQELIQNYCKANNSAEVKTIGEAYMQKLTQRKEQDEEKRLSTLKIPSSGVKQEEKQDVKNQQKNDVTTVSQALTELKKKLNELSSKLTLLKTKLTQLLKKITR